MHHAYQVIFFYKVFTQTQNCWGRSWGQFLFLYPTSNRSQKFRHFFATLHVRWLQVFLVSITLLLDQIYHLATALTLELMMMEC